MVRNGCNTLGRKWLQNGRNTAAKRLRWVNLLQLHINDAAHAWYDMAAKCEACIMAVIRLPHGYAGLLNMLHIKADASNIVENGCKMIAQWLPHVQCKMRIKTAAKKHPMG